MGAMVMESAGTTTNVAQFNASCHSFSVLPGKSTNASGAGPVTFFTSYDGSFDGVLYQTTGDGSLLFSHEFSPRWGGEPGAYVADYAVCDAALNIIEHGAVLLELPATDADGNGLADAVQLDRPGTVTTVGSWVRFWPTQELASLVGTITRKANEKTGQYSFFISNDFGSMTITGAMRLYNISGEATFTRGNDSFCVAANWTDLRGITTNDVACVSEYSMFIENTDVLRIEHLVFGDWETQHGVELNLRLARTGNVYREEGTFNGALDTGWDDYSKWTIEVIAPGDADTNDVPDLTDFVPGAPCIIHPPADLITVAGANAFLHVDASGAEPLQYQWYSNSVALNYATNAVLSFAPVTTNSAANYFVQVSNAAGSVFSSHAMVKVLHPIVGEIELDWALHEFVPVNKLAFDTEGNLIAGGTAKISPTGQILSRISAPSRDFAMDGEDNVYVTGSVGNSEGDYDIVTAKYDRSGNEVWTAAAGIEGKYDEAVAIALDQAGNVYVAGWTGGEPEQYLLVKYNSAGQQQWQRTYGTECVDHGLLSLAVDGSGAYVAGWGAVVKYEGDGDVAWTMSCTNFWPLKLKLDRIGNLLIGFSLFGNGYGISKRTPDGAPLWELRYTNGLQLGGVAVDANENVYVGNSAGQVLKIDAAGALVWTGNNAGIFTLGAAGEVYSTGTVRDNTSTRNTDIFTRKISPQGADAWSVRYADPYIDTDFPVSIAVDGEDSVYVGGVLGRIFPVIIKYIQPAMGASVRPSRQTAAVGSTVAFNAFYRGASSPVSYEWIFGNDPIVGGTSATLILGNISTTSAGDYRVVITDGLGNQSSATARLTVLAARPTRFGFDPSLGWFLDAEPGPYWLETSADLVRWTKYSALQTQLSRTQVQMPIGRLPREFFRAVQRH
jgi:hypothetical protein